MLIKCPECGKSISDSAKSCPNCGYWMGKRCHQCAYFFADWNDEDDHIMYCHKGRGTENLSPACSFFKQAQYYEDYGDD